MKNMFKKSFAFLLAALMIFAAAPIFGLPEAKAAVAEDNYRVSTEFYCYDEESGKWVIADDTVDAGEDVKMRVSIETGFVSGAAELLLAYDKSVLSAPSVSSTSSSYFTLNTSSTFVQNSMNFVLGASGKNNAANQVGLGNITQEQFAQLDFIYCNIYTRGCVAYDGSDWIFEVDMTVLRGTKDKTLECFIIPSTVCTMSNSKGCVKFPKAPEGSTSSSSLVSPWNWYEGTPEIASQKVTVFEITGNALFDANGGKWADGSDEKAVEVGLQCAITAPDAPQKAGYDFAGWSSDGETVCTDLGFMESTDGKSFSALWAPSDNTEYTVETYTMNILGDYDKSSETFTGTTNETVTAAPEISEGFSLNSKKSVLSGTVAADGSLVLSVYIDRNTYTLTTTVDGVETKTNYLYGAAISQPASPSKQGYTFAGWTPSIPDAMPAENLTFNAQWTANSYNASFDANGGKWADGSDKKDVATNYESEIIAPEAPEKLGYLFSGWSADGETVCSDLGIMDSVDGKSFVALWVASDDILYTVETYKMNTSGEYEKSVQNFIGTTDETVSVTPEIGEGFSLNSERSVLSGTVAGDSSLVLTVYIDRNSYTLTTIVDGVDSKTDYLYGAAISQPSAPSKQGYTFAGWDNSIPQTMPANNVTVTAIFRIATTIQIKNNPGSKTINYGETLKLTAVTANLPEGGYVKWFVEGSGVKMSQSADGETCRIESTGNGTVTVTAKVVDKNGNSLSNANGEISDSQTVVSKAGFWQKIVSFFKNLFGSNREIVQLFKGIF